MILLILLFTPSAGMFHRWLKICVYVRAFACLVEGACVHLLCCSVRKADSHKFVVSNICLHISVCASALCFFWDGKRKGFGRPVERSLNPPPPPGLGSLLLKVWLQFAHCLQVQIYDLFWLSWTKEGIEDESIHWAPSSSVLLRAT